ncbi:MAG TPA: SDR family oxidoreductase [Chitinophagaceae bacterium]|nr:SDR family oxidoreductase [Chitinophagaceae bacterium]
MLLQNKNAVIYGAGGSIGSAVARVFAKEGARVFLTGRNLASVQKTANEILDAGGKVEVEVVDALDEKAVNNHIDTIVGKAGAVDISFNAIGLEDTQNIPLTEMSLADFLRPVTIAMNTQFITSTAAGRVMMKQGSGVILSITATPGGIGYPLVGGFGPACCAIEGFSRDLAAELGPYGIRVVNIRSAGSPDSRPFVDAIAHDSEEANSFIKKLEDDTMLKKLPLMADIADTAVFLASGMAGKITGVTIDVTCGTTSGLNYKIPAIPFG